MAVGPYTESFTVRGYEVGADSVLTVQNLSNYFQEAAGLHAASLDVSLERLQSEGISWVLSRLNIGVNGLPRAGESLSVETWPVCIEGLQFRRDFVARTADGAVAAAGVSRWLVVNLSTRRIVRIPAFISGMDLENPRTAMEDADAKLPDLSGEEEALRVRVRLADMDRNRHVNNVRYADWILEATPGAVRESCALRGLDLSFRAESLHGDTVIVRTRREEGENGAVGFNYGLFRTGDDKELVRGRALWQKKSVQAIPAPDLAESKKALDL